MKSETISILAGLFGALIGAAASVLTIIVQQHFETRREQMRLHQSDLLLAYKTLYAFVAHLEDMLSPPEDPRRDFRDLMQRNYYREVKPQMLLFPPAIRELLSRLESQDACLGNPDLIPTPPFDEFINKEVGRILRKLRRLVEGMTDHLLGF